MKKPLITLAIPVYNRGKLFEYSLISVLDALMNLEKGFNDLVEVLIIDDCSTENIFEIFDRVINIYKYPSTRFIRNKVNSGRKNIYFDVVNYARGKYVWTLGSDDFLYHDSFNRLLNYVNKYQNVLVFITNMTHYKINIDSLQNYNRESGFISDLIIKEGVSSNHAPKDDVGPANLVNFIHPIYHNVYLGAIMAVLVDRKLMRESLLSESQESKDQKFQDVFAWYRNTYHLSMSFLNKAAYYIADPLVIAGDGAQDWSIGSSGGLWNSDYPFILFKVVPNIVQLHKENGLIGNDAYSCENEVAKIVGNLFLPILWNRFISKKIKYSLSELNFLSRLAKSILFPGFYFGLIGAVYRTLKKV
jgi:hypothetical protein